MQQVATTNGTTTTTSYVGSLEEVSTTGSATTTTAYYGGLALSVNGALSYTLSDGLGSVSEAVNPSGAVTASQLYAPYGNVRFQSGTLPTDQGFTGQRSDAATSGLDYYGARYYDPVAGQFTSADTTLAGGLNRYGYVGGNPETFVDPSGHELRPGDEGIGAYLSGDGDDVGGGGGGGDGSGSGNNNGSVTDPVITEVSIGNGETEDTYVADNDSFIETADNQIVGVLDATGTLETNAQIEAQIEANSAERLDQGDNRPEPTDPQSPKTSPTSDNPGQGLPTFTKGGKTTGAFVGPDGNTTTLLSGHSDPDSSLQPRTQLPDNLPGMVKNVGSWDHVEAHAASLMRLEDLQQGELWINNPSGPCMGILGCNANLPNMLPEGATLTVYFPGGEGGSWLDRMFVGLPDDLWTPWKP